MYETLPTTLVEVAAGTPTIAVDATLAIQAVIFLALWGFLSVALFRPYLKARHEREAQTMGARGVADDLETKANRILSDYEAKLAEARSEASDARREKVAAGSEKADVIVAEARQVAEADAAKARAELDEELATARKSVVPQAKALSEAITAKVLA